MSRTYLVFGSDDGELWKPIGTVDANTHEQAQDTAADQVPGYSHYGSTTRRGWRSRSVNEKVVRRWNPYELSGGQMTVDEVLVEQNQAKVDKLVEEAKDALDKPLLPKSE